MRRMHAAMKGFIGRCCLGRRETRVMDADQRNQRETADCVPAHPHLASMARQSLLPVAAIGALALFFRIKMHVGRNRADKNIGVL